MQINHQQKLVVVLSTALIVVLSAITIFNRPDLEVRDSTDSAAIAAQNRADEEEYQRYLASIQTDPAASKALMQDLIKQEDVKKDIETQLGVNRPVVVPVIADSSLTITQETGQAAMIRYFSDLGGIYQNVEASAAQLDATLFNEEANGTAAATTISQVQSAAAQMKQVRVPVEAAAFHKAEMIVLGEYVDTLNQARLYQSTQNADWTEVYQSYAVAAKAFANVSVEASKLETKYSLGLDTSSDFAQTSIWDMMFGAKVAQAQFGGTIVIKDIPRILEFAFTQAVSRIFAKFAISMIQRLITTIQNNFQISNFLYYTDALVQGQYTEDYLTKYISSASDRNIIKKLIPQFSCSNTSSSDLKIVYKQKAREHIGFDPNSVKPTDPDFYIKMQKMGEFFSSPFAYELYLEDIAAGTAAEAKSAAYLEQLAPGLKVSREVDKRIAQSLKSIDSSIQSGFQAIFDLGTGDTSKPATAIVAAVMENLFNKFLFKGAVYKEQKICIDAAQINPVTPIGEQGFDQTGTPPEPK